VWHLGQADRNEKTHLSFSCGMVLHILIEIVKISKQFFFSNFHIFWDLSVFFFPRFVPVIGQGRVLCANDFLAFGVMGSSQNIFQSFRVTNSLTSLPRKNHVCTQK